MINSFSAHENEEFLEAAKSHNIDTVLIPGGCTSKVQPLDVCLNKPFKSILRKNWLELIKSVVETDPNPSKLAAPSKELVCKWIKSGLNYFEAKQPMVKKAFLMCGITNALNGSKNELICCTKELPDLWLPYVDESTDNVF